MFNVNVWGIEFICFHFGHLKIESKLIVKNTKNIIFLEQIFKKFVFTNMHIVQFNS